MKKIISLPHKVCNGTCYVNGLEDVLAWKGGNYMDFLLSVAGGMASFAYLKFKLATPPNMVFFGTNTKYFLRNLEEIIGFKQEISEGKSYKTVGPKIKEAIINDEPVMAGALDMYYLHYYPKIYGRSHIPIHYFLVVGFDDEQQLFYVHDCGKQEVQQIPYAEFEKALNVTVPGMSKKNTFRAFKLPERIPSELEVAKKGFAQKADQMLNPPVKLFGIPAMRKLSNEIVSWEDKESFEHLATYATTPPTLPESFEHSDGQRFAQADVLRSLGEKYGISEWSSASQLFHNSGKLVIQLCKAAIKQDSRGCSGLLSQIADIEEKAYGYLDKPVA